MSNESKPKAPAIPDKELPELLDIKASPEQILELVGHLQAGLPIAVAAVAAGIPPRESGYPRLAGIAAKVEAEYEARLMRMLSHAAVRDWHAAAFLLERRFPERWGRHQAEERAKAASSVRVRVAVPQASPEEHAADEAQEEQSPVQAAKGAE
jgi:hypothetical protein